MEWLKKEAKTERGIFFAHNCSFDSRVLLRHASHQLKSCIVGFIDSIAALKGVLPERDAGYSVSALQRDLLPEFVFEAHNAAEDVRVLCAILTAAKITSDLLLSASESLPSYEARLAFPAGRVKDATGKL